MIEHVEQVEQRIPDTSVPNTTSLLTLSLLYSVSFGSYSKQGPLYLLYRFGCWSVFGTARPPRLRRFPGNLPTLRRRQRLRPRRPPGLATHAGDVGQPFRGEVPCPCPSALGSAELPEGHRVGVFLAWHREATIVRYRTGGVLT